MESAGEAFGLSRYVFETDSVPDFWNFLLGLSRDDIVSELIQNDLDQQATCTVISFEREELSCEGNGRPVDASGWLRLRTIRGAGDRVPAKVGKIGVKNHGLKTAFTIGDELEVLSDGKSIIQTLYARGKDAAPYPGALNEPVPNPMAPASGCRIVVSYRRRKLEPREGEALSLRPVSDEGLEKMYWDSCQTLPEQLLGIVCPQAVPTYEVVLRHWRCGEVVYRFSASRPRPLARGIVGFRRRCVVTGSIEGLPQGQEEDVARRHLPLKGPLRRRTPDYFRRKGRFFCEVSWRVDRRGRPQPANGRFRYPIGYPEGTSEARTGHGFSFNAPLVSDAERHAPAWEDATNIDLRASCEGLLVEVLARRLVPKWGAHALRMLIPRDVPHAEKRVRSLLAALVERNAMPTLSSAEAIALLTKTSRSTRRPMSVYSVDKSLRPKYQFVIPALTWRGGISTPMAIVSPAQERQLDPRVDSEIIELLASTETPGFPESFLTFDETDALSRMKGEGNSFFSACPDMDREMGDPIRAKAYLDIIAAVTEHQEKPTANEIQEVLQLPDATGRVTLFRQLFSSASLPTDIPGLRLPPLLHPDLATHPLFRQKAWRPPRYTLASFLSQSTLADADESVRKRFWQWLNQYQGRLSSSERTRLAEIAIWPDEEGHLQPLRELCAPRSKGLSRALGESIRRAHREVLTSKILAGVSSGPASLRRSPTPGEIDDFLQRRLNASVVGEIADDETRSVLKCLEADLSALVRDLGVKRLTQGQSVELPALAADGSIRLRSELVSQSRHLAHLQLPPRFILPAGTARSAVERVSPVRPRPSADMLEAALVEDSANTAALQARLEAILSVTARGDPARQRLADIAFIPCAGRLHPPNDVALKGSKGDYWGRWKVRVPTTDLPQDAQQRYLQVGVTSANPKPETSVAFFSWLSRQDPQAIASHLSCVIRHLVSPSGPSSWGAEYPNLPVVAVERAGQVSLVSISDLRHKRVYLPDHVIAEQVGADDPSVSFAIARVSEVREPATEILSILGLRSLAETVGDPERVEGLRPAEKPTQLQKCLERLRSPQLERTLLKRLDSLGIERSVVWRDWRDRLLQIRSVQSAERVQATYRFLRRTYRVTVDADVDRESHTFWVQDGQPDAESRLYEAIAARCIFKPGARPLYYLALQRAVETQVDDRSYGRPDPAEAEQEGEERETPTGTGESIFGHSPFEPDLSKNTPRPGPIPTRDGVPASRGAGASRGNGARHGARERAPAREQEQVEALKEQHYASHCQMCLCDRPPTQLAPEGSYVQWEEVRRRIIEAHHVDPKAGGGARHAGNVILLCKFHHDNFGRRLVRQWIVEALSRPTERRAVFFNPTDETSVVEGQVVGIVLPDTGETITLFFTDFHAEYWLAQAADSEPVGAPEVEQ